MAALLYIYHLPVIHHRTAVIVGNRKICKAGKHIQTGKDTAVLLDHGDIGLYLTHQLRIYLSFKGIYPFLGTKDLLLIFLQFFGYIALGIDQSLLPYPFLRHSILISVAHLEIVSENIVEAYLERRYACAVNLPLLHFKQILLAVAGNLSELVKLFIHTFGNHVSLSKLGSSIRMHCLSEIFKKSGTVAHASDKFIQRPDSFPPAKLHYRIRLAQTSFELHHLTRHDLAGSSTRDYSFQISDIPDHGLEPCQIIPVFSKILNYGIPVLQLLQVHHRHCKPCPEHSGSHRRRASVHHLNQRCTLLACS